MLGSQLDGIHIKEADKVPRRSLTFKQPPNKRAKVEENVPTGIAHTQSTTNDLQLCASPPPLQLVVASSAPSSQSETLRKDSPASVSQPNIVHPISATDNYALSLVQEGKWAEFRRLADQRTHIDFKVVYALLHAGQVDLLVYARINGCFRCKTKRLIQYAERRKVSLEIINELNEKMRGDIPCGGSNLDLSDLPMNEALERWVAALQKDQPLRSLMNLRQQNCPWTCIVCEKAVRYGHYEALEYLLQEECPTGTNLYKLIIERELWHFLPLIAKHGYKLDPKIRFEFARHGQIDGLRATVECGMKMVSEVCVLAALNGHLNCLLFAHSNGAKIDQKVCLGAVQQGHLSCVRYALEHGCVMTKTLASQAVKFKHMHILQYLHEQGCPMDKATSKLVEAFPVPAAVELDIAT